MSVSRGVNGRPEVCPSRISSPPGTSLRSFRLNNKQMSQISVHVILTQFHFISLYRSCFLFFLTHVFSPDEAERACRVGEIHPDDVCSGLQGCDPEIAGSCGGHEASVGGIDLDRDGAGGCDGVAGHYHSIVGEG